MTDVREFCCIIVQTADSLRAILYTTSTTTTIPAARLGDQTLATLTQYHLSQHLETIGPGGLSKVKSMPETTKA